MLPIRVISFDFTNTLSRFASHPSRIYETVLRERLGAPTLSLSREAFSDALKRQQPSNFDAVYWDGVVARCVELAANVDAQARAAWPQQRTAIVNELMRRFEDGKHAYEVVPGTVEALERLAREQPHVRLAVLSNNDSRLHSVLESLQLLTYFGDNVVVSSSTNGLQKPDPRIFHHLLHAVANLSPADAPQLMHVGDDLQNDVCGAVRAGALAVHFDPKAAPQSMADRVQQLRQRRFTTITTLTEVPDLTQALNRT
jgi:HAD superfamily hydrolase (TIGR01549 family)